MVNTGKIRHETHTTKFTTLADKGDELMEYEIISNSEQIGEYKEKLDIPDNQDPKKFVKKIFDEFNRVEKEKYKENKKYKPDVRKLVKILEATGILYCDFSKANTITILRNDQAYDILKCSNCNIFRKRFGLNETPTHIICKPNVTCKECNRIFKTQKGYDNHMKKGKHKTPDWLPDGV